MQWCRFHVILFLEMLPIQGISLDIALPLGTQKLAWFSPILVQPINEPASFSNNLTRQALEVLDDYQRKGMPGLRDVVCGESQSCSNAGFNEWIRFQEPHHFNDAFYHYQVSQGSRLLQKNPMFVRLRQYVLAATAKMITGTGSINGANGANIQEEPFCWVSVHRHGSGSFHPAHTHAGSSFSTVYFASVPTFGVEMHQYVTSPIAPLVFRDPRGPRPPFDQFIAHYPSTGELLVFPSWLEHEVRATGYSSNQQREGNGEIGSNYEWGIVGGSNEGIQYRVSISCNTRGDWKQSSDLSVSFDS
jgi:hypothetical protein